MRAGDLRRDAERVDYAAQAEKQSRTHRFVLGIISLGVGIPITAISAYVVNPDILGVAVSWAGIVGVNIAAAVGARRRPPAA
jgi:hypothetical protein